jgi:hypothetical protein
VQQVEAIDLSAYAPFLWCRATKVESAAHDSVLADIDSASGNNTIWRAAGAANPPRRRRRP